MCIYSWCVHYVYTGTYGDQGVRSPVAGVTDGCKIPNIGARS